MKIKNLKNRLNLKSFKNVIALADHKAKHLNLNKDKCTY